jgi:hypothetical protein
MTTTDGVTCLMTATICACMASAPEPDEASVVDGDVLAAGSTAGRLAASVEVAVDLFAEELAAGAGADADAQPATITATSAKAAIGVGKRRVSRRMSNVISSSWWQPAWYHGGIE